MNQLHYYAGYEDADLVVREQGATGALAVFDDRVHCNDSISDDFQLGWATRLGMAVEQLQSA